MKRFQRLLMTLAALHLALVISSSTELELDCHEPLHCIVHALTQRLAQLEVDLTKSNVIQKLDFLENELQKFKDENRFLRNNLLKLEEKLQQIMLNPIDRQYPMTDLIQQNQKTMEKVFSLSNGDNKPEARASEIGSNQNISGNSTYKDVTDENNNGPINHVLDIMSATNTIGIKLGRQILTRQTPGEQVAFFAQVTPATLCHLGLNQIVPFDRTITNVGGAYHAHTGVFIAPYSGLYVFHMSAMLLASGDYQYLQLTKDGVAMQNLYLLKTTIESTSVTVVLDVTKGSEVWVKAGAGSGCIHGNGFTIFTGWLLQQF